MNESDLWAARAVYKKTARDTGVLSDLRVDIQEFPPLVTIYANSPSGQPLEKRLEIDGELLVVDNRVCQAIKDLAEMARQ